MRQLEQYLTNTTLPYFEPFVGYAGVLKHMSVDSNRLCSASDLNPDVVAMWRSLQNGWIPRDHCTKDEFMRLKQQTTPSAERGFYGIVCSFGAQFFHTYRKPSATRDFIKAGVKGVTRAVQNMKDVRFMDPADYATSYSRLPKTPHLIYCDPPYRNNRISNSYFQFDHDTFWNDMRAWSQRHLVVVSEYTAPGDFVATWSHGTQCNYSQASLGTHVTKSFVEQMFIHSDTYNSLCVAALDR